MITTVIIISIIIYVCSVFGMRYASKCIGWDFDLFCWMCPVVNTIMLLILLILKIIPDYVSKVLCIKYPKIQKFIDWFTLKN